MNNGHCAMCEILVNTVLFCMYGMWQLAGLLFYILCVVHKTWGAMIP
jgi:hypothetical protein